MSGVHIGLQLSTREMPLPQAQLPYPSSQPSTASTGVQIKHQNKRLNGVPRRNQSGARFEVKVAILQLPTPPTQRVSSRGSDDGASSRAPVAPSRLRPKVHRRNSENQSSHMWSTKLSREPNVGRFFVEAANNWHVPYRRLVLQFINQRPGVSTVSWQNERGPKQSDMQTESVVKKKALPVGGVYFHILM